MRKRVEPSTCFPSRVWRATVLLRPTRATINPLMALSLRSNPSLHPSPFAPLVCPTPVRAPTRILSVTYSSVSLSQPLPFTLFLLPAGSRIASLSFRSTARSSPLLFIDLSPASTSPAQLHYTLSSMSSFIPLVSLYHRLSYSLTSGHLLGYLPLPANLSFFLPHSSLLFHSFLLPFLPHYPLFLLFFTNSLCLYFTLSAFFYPRCFVSRSLLLWRSPDDPSPSASSPLPFRPFRPFVLRLDVSIFVRSRDLPVFTCPLSCFPITCHPSVPYTCLCRTSNPFLRPHREITSDVDRRLATVRAPQFKTAVRRGRRR